MNKTKPGASIRRRNALALADALMETFVGKFVANGNAPYWAMEFKLNLGEIDASRLDEQLEAHGYFRLVTGPKNEVCRLVKGYGAVCAFIADWWYTSSSTDEDIKLRADAYYDNITSEQEVFCFKGELSKQDNHMGGTFQK